MYMHYYTIASHHHRPVFFAALRRFRDWLATVTGYRIMEARPARPAGWRINGSRVPYIRNLYQITGFIQSLKVLAQTS